MPEHDTPSFSPEQIADVRRGELIPKNVFCEFSADFETLYLALETENWGRSLPVRIPAASLPKLFQWLADAVNEAAQKKLGGQKPSPQDGGATTMLPLARVYVRAALEGQNAGAVVVDMGVCRFAVPCDTEELRALATDAIRIADAVGGTPPGTQVN